MNYRKLLLAAVAACTVGIGSAQAAMMQDSGAGGGKLEGTWIVQVGLQDCVSGSPMGLPFLSLLTFARGGTMTETTDNPVFYPAVRSPGHGVWQKVDEHTYQAATIAFITVNGVLARTQTIRQTIEVQDEDTFRTTSAAVKFYRPDGSLLATGCAAATGKRFELAE